MSIVKRFCLLAFCSIAISHCSGTARTGSAPSIHTWAQAVRQFGKTPSLSQPLACGEHSRSAASRIAALPACDDLHAVGRY